MDIKPGDIYWVTIAPAQVIGSEQHSRRPFLIVSRILLNRSSKLVVAVPLTTTRATEPGHPPHRIVIPANEIARDPLFNGDIKDSVALTDQVRALDKTRLEKKIGTLSDTGIAAVGLGLAYIFDLR